MINAQVLADKTNSGVKVNFRGYTTFVEPNLPAFSNSELSSRLTAALKGVLVQNKEKEKEHEVVLPSDDEHDDDDEIDIFSQSILPSGRAIKEEKRQVFFFVFF